MDFFCSAAALSFLARSYVLEWFFNWQSSAIALYSCTAVFESNIAIPFSAWKKSIWAGIGTQVLRTTYNMWLISQTTRIQSLELTVNQLYIRKNIYLFSALETPDLYKKDINTG